MQINVAIESILEKALAAALSPDVLQTKIEEQITKTVDAALSDAFGSYGQFRETVKTSIKALVPHDVTIEGQAKFRDVIIKAVSGRVQAFNDEKLLGQLDEALGNLLEQPPERIKMSELANKVVEMWSDNNKRHGSDRPTIIVDRVEGACDGYHNIFIDPEWGKSKWECRCQIDCQDNGKAYSVKVSGETAGKSLFIGPVYDFDRYLLWLYTGGTKLIVDRYDFDDLYYNQSNED